MAVKVIAFWFDHKLSDITQILSELPEAKNKRQ